MKLIYGLVSAILLLIAGCSDKSGGQPNSNRDHSPDTTAVVQPVRDSIFNYQISFPVHWSSFKLKGISSLKILDSLYGKDGRRTILALNRMDQRNIRRGDSIVVPDTILHLISYSPFPFELPEANPIPKLLLISRKIQAFAAYENGILRKWGPTSTGRRSKQTPDGLFSMNWKSKETISTIDSTWILPFYFNFHNKEGIAVHEFSMPGYPASHACVRLLRDDAQWIWYWAEQWIVTPDGERVAAHGTPLIVYDDYKFGSPPPWKFLPQNPDTLGQDTSVLNKLIADRLPKILERKEIRDSVIARREELKRLAAEKMTTEVRN